MLTLGHTHKDLENLTKRQIRFAVTTKQISILVFATWIIQCLFFLRIQNFKRLAIFCRCTDRFVSDLVANHIVSVSLMYKLANFFSVIHLNLKHFDTHVLRNVALLTEDNRCQFVLRIEFGSAYRNSWLATISCLLRVN